MKYILDKDKVCAIELSNDAYYYLLYGEELLDEANQKDIDKLNARFPFGFELSTDNDIQVNEEQGTVIISVIPYKPSEEYNAYWAATKYVQYRILWLDSDNIKAWRYNNKTGENTQLGVFPVKTNSYNKKYFSIKPTSPGAKQETILFLDGFIKNNE